MRNNDRNDSHDVVVNPAALAEEIRSMPEVIDDDRLDLGCEIPAYTKSAERARSRDLGRAAQDEVLDRRLPAITGERATADRHEAALLAAEPVWSQVEDDFVTTRRLASEARATRNATVADKRARISLYGKGLFVVGDTAVIAVPLWRIGTPTVLSVLTGISAALSMVALGSKFGKTREEGDQRESRGDPPAGCPAGLVDLYRPTTVEDAWERDRGASTVTADVLWLTIGTIAAVVLGVAVTAVGTAGGEQLGTSLTAGLLAMLTFPGSAALEAYGFNAAADRAEHLARVANENLHDLGEFIATSQKLREHRSRAAGLERAALHAASAVGITNAHLADRTTDNPRIHGYQPQDQPISDGVALGPQIDRSTEKESPADSTRPVYDRRRSRADRQATDQPPAPAGGELRAMRPSEVDGEDEGAA